MIPPRNCLHTLGAAVLALLTAPALAAQAPDGLSQASQEIAIGSEGEIYRVQLGTYGELFPPGSAGSGLADGESQALALEIVRDLEGRQRLLVPGTETADFEDSASVLYEDGTRTLFVLWQTRVNTVHWQLNLIGLRDGAWTEPVEISGNPFGWKGSPQLQVTRDSFVTELPDETLRRWHRTVAHLIWLEEGSHGQYLLYSPIVFIDGVYIGWNPVYPVRDLGLSSADAGIGLYNSLLAAEPRIEPGRNAQSVVLAFVDDFSGEVLTASIEVLPGEIAHLADRVRAQIIDVGRTRDPQGIQSLSDKVRAQIIDVGREIGVHPAVASYLAKDVEGLLESLSSNDDFTMLADRVRAQIIDVGSRLTGRGVDRSRLADKVQVVDLPTGDFPMAGGVDLGMSGAAASVIAIERLSVHSAPATGMSPHEVYLSRSGRDLLVAWRQEDTMRYRESRGDGWSAVRTLDLGEDLDPRLALEALSARADGLSSDR